MQKHALGTSPWLDSVPGKRRFPPLLGRESADVVVIGGGIVGVMAAWRLAQTGKKVVLLEKGRIAEGGTGYTTALVTRIPDTSCAKIAKTYGTDFLRKVFAATQESEAYLQELIEKERLSCDFAQCDSYNCSYRKGDKALKEEWGAIKPAEKRVKFLSGASAAAYGAPLAEAICTNGEARFDSRKFIFGLLGRPGANSLKVFEESEVAEVSVLGDVEVRTKAGGSVSAKKVIIATGMPILQFKLPKELEHNLTFAIVANYPNGAPFSDDIFWDTGEPYFYYRRLDGHKIIVGGADVPAGHARGNGAGRKKLEAFLGKRFPGKYEITNEWSGSIFSSEDGLPYIGEHPSHPGKVLVASGFGGNGMVMGAMAGMILSDLASGRENLHAKLFSLSRNMGAKPAENHSQAASPSAMAFVAPAAYPASITFVASIAYFALILLLAFFFFGAHGGISYLAGVDLKTMSYLLFPLVGLYAFTLVWVQLLTGSNMDVLRKSFPNADKFHRAEGVLALLFAFAHPLMLFFGVGLPAFVALAFVPAELVILAWLGMLQLLTMACTALSAMLMSHPWLRTRWRAIHLANYALFFMVFVHSWFLGHDVQSTPIRYIWIFYALTVGASIAFRAMREIGKRNIKAGESMGNFVKVASVKDVVSGKPHCVEANGVQIALFLVNGKYYALENKCSHAGGPLCGGALEGNTVVCPWHGSKFDVATGKVVAPPATVPQKAFKVRVLGENIEVMV